MVLAQSKSMKDVDTNTVDSMFASRYVQAPLPKWRLPEKETPQNAAYQVIGDELMLDGNPRLNLASFVTTWMEPECDKLIQASLSKNYIDMDEYPITTEIQDRCVNMIARLFNAPLEDGQSAVGAGTVGSSEAIMLAGLAFKRKWQLQRKAAGLPWDKPNMVTGANVQVCWEKFSNYFEVEIRDVKLSEDCYVMDPAKAVELCDENTICVCAILGSTYNGEFEDVGALNDLLDKKNKEKGWNIPIHVDAASGGFVAPFLYPDLVWDFRLPLVKSINVSGHKYGLVYAGIGWVVWRGKEDLPEELIFHVNYLGADQPTFTLNFSKGASQVIAQYYQFIRLGFEGYRKIICNCEANSKVLADAIVATGRFKLLSKPVGVPLVAFSLINKTKFDEFDVADGLRRFGWTVPAYTMAPNAQSISLLRVVVREDFSRSLADRLITDLKRVMATLDAQPAKLVQAVAESIQEQNPELAESDKSVKEIKEATTVDDSSFHETVKKHANDHKQKKAQKSHKKHSIHKTNGVC
jgi:glutamate decarboxylase